MQTTEPAGRPHRDHGPFSGHYPNVALPGRRRGAEGDEPTAFGEPAARGRGIGSPELLDLDPGHQRAPSDHFGNVANDEPYDPALAAARSIRGSTRTRRPATSPET